MKIIKIFSVFVGVTLLIVATFSNELAIRFAPAVKATSPEVHTAKFVQIGIDPFSELFIGLDYKDDVKVTYTLVYPKERRVNQTQTVKLIFDRTFDRDNNIPKKGDDIYEAYNDAMQQGDLVKTHQIFERRKTTLSRPPLDEPFSLSLTSSALEITPQTEHTLPIGTQLPIEFEWTVTPTSSGNHRLILDLSGVSQINAIDEAYIEGRKIKSAILTVDDIPQDISNKSALELPIIVESAWGVQSFIEDIVRLVLVLLGIVFMKPLMLLKN